VRKAIQPGPWVPNARPILDLVDGQRDLPLARHVGKLTASRREGWPSGSHRRCEGLLDDPCPSAAEFHGRHDHDRHVDLAVDEECSRYSAMSSEAATAADRRGGSRREVGEM
jgi:hypothetical protein